MKIILAGYNVEASGLPDSDPLKPPLTPEVFSAAYARISRSPRDIEELREKAREDIRKARKSNKTIIFEMGHHSVAEHAVFNFDIIGISRLAMEELEHFRLVSFTEKSQRYVTLKGDFFLPRSLEENPFKADYLGMIGKQNRFYQNAFTVLHDHVKRKNPRLAREKSNRRLLEGWAKEDARYALSLATQGQTGMTINARNLEYLFRRFALSELPEIHCLRKELHAQVMSIAPSLILFSDPSAFEKDLARTDRFSGSELPPLPEKDFKVVDHTPEGDHKVLAALLMEQEGGEYTAALQQVNRMPAPRRKKLFLDLFTHCEFFDRPPRHFEIPHLTFQAVVSASAFAQLKRHRMATLISGPYRPELGVTRPPAISETGLEEDFDALLADTQNLHLRLKPGLGKEADYILTNAHRRTVLMKMNLREIYHFSRLREDEHAQWDIRQLAGKVSREARRYFPLATCLLGGKSDYNARFAELYGRQPEFRI